MIITVTLNPSFDKTLEVLDFAPGRTLKARTLRRQPAGKGVNVSRCIAALGGQSIATGFLGDAEIAAYKRSFHGAAGRASVQFVSVPGDTRQNVTIRDPEHGTETHLREQGFTVGQADLYALHRKLDELLKPGDVAVFAGSLPPGMHPEHLAELVRRCTAAGCRVAADTSGPALAHAVSAGVWLAKPNREELQELVAEPVDSDDAIKHAARRLLDRVEILLVTLGAHGAFCFARDAAWRGVVAVENVRNSVGAGDAFLAGFILSHTRGLQPDACLCAAVACGAASTQEQWAGEIDPRTVERLARSVHIEKL